ncbi:MAG: hypothetical protein EOO38_10755 [Cytophagaceae bacterium]|nr:MAG: hypothetical protein EOO38_10755 [Cytophagaceae bacterium]
MLAEPQRSKRDAAQKASLKPISIFVSAIPSGTDPARDRIVAEDVRGVQALTCILNNFAEDGLRPTANAPASPTSTALYRAAHYFAPKHALNCQEELQGSAL